MPSSETPHSSLPPSEPIGSLTAARHLPSHLRIWPVAIGGVALDLWSKDWAFRGGNVPPDGRVIVDKALSFQLSLNSGALFGLGRGMAPLFVAASVLALLFVWYLFMQSGRDRLSLHVALGLILGGALGNLYDRSFHDADAVFGPPAPGFWHGLLGDHVWATGVLLNDPSDPVWQIGRYPDGKGEVRATTAFEGTSGGSAVSYAAETPVHVYTVFTGLSTGSHTVQIWTRGVGATSITLNQGNFGQDVFVTEVLQN